MSSGSEGNAALLATSTTRLLIDAGLSVAELRRRLAFIGEQPEDLTAAVITHEHSDHCSGVGRLVRASIRRGRVIPIYTTRLTAARIDWDQMESPPVEHFRAGAAWRIGDIAVRSFTVPHDAADPVGLYFEAEGARIGFVTDLGYIPEALPARFREAQVVFIESNYDVEKLMQGDYTFALKQRIAGRTGHLSNSAVAGYIDNGLGTGVDKLVLGHLSAVNNDPALALATAEEALGRRGLRSEVLVALQHEVLAVL